MGVHCCDDKQESAALGWVMHGLDQEIDERPILCGAREI
jgi:hypothetical protein